MKNQEDSKECSLIDALLIGYYHEKSIPKPNFMECLTDYIKASDNYESIQNKIMESFHSGYERMKSSEESDGPYPRETATFIIPLDYYMPIPEEYYAGTCTIINNEPAYIQTSIYSLFVEIGKDKIKVSYIAVSICHSLAAKIKKDIEKGSSFINQIYDIAIDEANRLIRSFRSIIGRHNHYIHEITRVSSPSKINGFIFFRDSKKLIHDTYFFMHLAPIHDIVSTPELDKNEMKEISNYHFNSGITNNNVLKLLSKLNDAINARCMGRDSESILLMESFVEYSLGFLYCECLRIQNPSLTLEESAKRYIKKSKESKFKPDAEIAEILGYQIKDFEEKTKKQEYKKACYKVRNVLIHNFFSVNANSNSSKEALRAAGAYIVNIAKIVSDKTQDQSTLEQVKILANATSILLEKSDGIAENI